MVGVSAPGAVHAASRHFCWTCPFNTGVYPVMEATTGAHGVACCICATPLEVGDVYMLLDAETDKPAVGRPAVGICACIGCAVNAGIAA